MRYIEGVDFAFDIRNEQPPNIEQIREHFPLQGREVFAYDKVIYNPSALELPNEILMHELVHFGQQGDDPQAWWDSYCVNTNFRFMEEVDAHVAEYRWMCRTEKNREKRARIRVFIAQKLCSGLYGKGFCSLQMALKAIK